VKEYKLFMGSWCFAFGFPEPAPLETILKVLSGFGYDGIALGAEFTGHAAPDQFPTKQSREELLGLINSYELEVAGYAPSPYSMPWATDGDAVLKEYDAYFEKCLGMAFDLGAPTMRVDNGSFGPLARDADYNKVWDTCVTTFKRHAKMAADRGIGLRFEVETGQVFVKPSEVVKMFDDVDEPNFMLDYDFGHAQAVSVLAHNQVQPLEKCDNGQVGFIEMLAGKIGTVGVNDCDNTTVMNEFATHLGLGRGVIDYDEVIPAIIAAGFRGPWWGVDCIPCSPDVWTDAWTGREKLSALLDKYL